MAITQIIATLPAVLNDSATFYEDIAIRNNSLVTVSFPSINTWATQANALAVEVNDKAAQVAAQAVDGGYSQTYINTNFVGVNNAQTIAGIKTFSANPISSAAQSSSVNALTRRDFVTTLDAQNIKLSGNQTIAGVKTFSSSPIVPTPTTGTQAVNKGYVDSIALPIGAILNGYTIFDNCIVAFGGEFNRADYPKLWAYLQANPSLVKTQAEWATESTANNGICGFFSYGNGTTTFRVPNLDKAFLRPDSRTVGSYQGDAFQGHWHNLYGTANQGLNAGNADNLKAHHQNFGAGAREAVSDGINGTPRVANETRPKNISVFPLIVAK